MNKFEVKGLCNIQLHANKTFLGIETIRAIKMDFKVLR